jgi:aldose 1-epimerase
MPAGIGLHPWLPRNDRTRFRSLHRGEWQTGATGLPLRLETGPQPRDWWDGQPVASRLVDTVYTGRVGSMAVIWPDTGLMLGVTPSDTLAFTVVYVPPGKHHFCVEPVSHMTDAVNRHEAAAFTGLRWLPRGEALIGNVRYDVMAIPTDDR